jgi:hypothetical protein
MSVKVKRRELDFKSVNDIMPEVDRLLKGYEKAGQWSLGQMCNHLTKSVVYSVEGGDISVPWFVRTFIAPLAKRHILKTRRMPSGIKGAPEAEPKSGLDDRAEAEALRAALAHYAMVTEPLFAHPVFGKLPRKDWDSFHCIHAAHHLGFALPLGDGTAQG